MIISDGDQCPSYDYLRKKLKRIRKDDMAYKGYLIDLDGTIYKGKTESGREAFVHELQVRKFYLFVTTHEIGTPEIPQMLAQNFGTLIPLHQIAHTATPK